MSRQKKTSQYYRDMDGLGDELKAIESSNGLSLLPNIPVYARLDGKKFSKFTKGMDKPYDIKLSNIMIEVTKEIVDKTGATVGYTQSDEISIYWSNEKTQQQMDFKGRLDKWIGELVGIATAKFMQLIAKDFPEKVDSLPRFDCRVFNCSQLDAAKFFIWRQMDANKNSVNLVASVHFSDKYLKGISSKERKKRLREMGDPWEDYSDSFKNGIYVSKFMREVKVETDNSIPEKVKKNMPKTIERSCIETFTIDHINKTENPIEIFNLIKDEKVNFITL